MICATNIESTTHPLNKLLKESPSSFLLDYVKDQFESIISCPSPKKKPSRDEYFSNINSEYYRRSKESLPSPPLSTSDRYHGYGTMATTNTFNPLDTPPITPTFDMPLRDYIEYVITKSRIDTGTVICSLSYAQRLKKKLSSSSKGMECTHHRIFLATLIITSKYVHDSALKNKYWVGYSQLFSASEINLMEKQLLQLLDYNLEISLENYKSITNHILEAQAQADLTVFQLDRCNTPFSEVTTIYLSPSLSPSLSPCTYYSCSPTSII